MKSLVLVALAITVLPGFSPLHSQKKTSAIATFWGHNLLKNGSAEASTDDPKNVPAWGRLEGFDVAAYGSEGGEWDWGLSGCATCGKQYLRLQFGEGTHELSVSQTVDASSGAAEIDKGLATAAFSAYLGGFRNSDTTGQLAVSFQDASGKELGTAASKPYSSAELPKAERGDTGLVLCPASALVPAGTRKIVFTWKGQATGDSGDYIALGDNFSLVLTVPPPPKN